MTALVECHNSPFGSQCLSEWCKGQRLHNMRVQGDEHAIVPTPIKIREPQGITAKLKSFRCPQNIAPSTQSPHASPVVIPDVQLVKKRYGLIATVTDAEHTGCLAVGAVFYRTRLTAGGVHDPSVIGDLGQ